MGRADVPLRDREDPDRDSVLLLPDALREFVAEVCARLGTDQDIAEVVAEHLVRANLAGHESHGVARLPGYAGQVAEGLLRPAGRPSVLRHAGATALFDAHYGFGHYSTRVALDWAIRTAGEHGISAAAVRHSQHIGRVGEYAERAAAAGTIALVTVGMAGPGVGAMVLPGTAQRFFGANPWAIGVPAGDNEPVIVDVSTAVVAEGKVQVARAAGDCLPEGWIVDAQGRPSTDPADYFGGGGLLPLGGTVAGHKGYGLGLASALLGALAMIDDPAPTLAGAPPPDGDDARGRVAGVWLMVINPDVFGDQDMYARSVQETIAAIRRSTPAGVQVRIPGEPEVIARAANQGGFRLARPTFRELVMLGRRFGVSLEQA